jgi:UDP-3-O-[3-hydroxymyristoyl] N-acetylglucosamine deacetylase
VTVSTVEHLLAALFALGIFDAEILLDGPEVPALDGSAAPFARALLAASRPVARSGPIWRVVRPVICTRGASACRLFPGGGLTIDCRIDFAHPAVGRQRVRLDVARQELFLRRFAPARTFGFLEEAAALTGLGLARGATLRSALVFGPAGPLNRGGSRFRDEPVRHKLVDALGDLALLGAGLSGVVRLERSSHRLVHQALRRGIADGALVREPAPGRALTRASITDPRPAGGHNRG